MPRSSLLTTKTLNTLIAVAVKRGCTVERDDESGNAIVTDAEGDECLRAIQKGDRNQTWIVTFGDTDQVRWDWPEESKP